MIQTIQLTPGVVLRHYPDKRFKTAVLSVQFQRPLCREEAALNALLSSVLLRGTEKNPDMRSITARLDSLYGANISPLMRRIGDRQTIGLFLSCLEDRFALPGDCVLEPSLELLREILLEPKLVGGIFDPEFVESEKKNLIADIESELNDKRSYAAVQMLRSMCAGDSFALSLRGEKADVEAISYYSGIPVGVCSIFACIEECEGFPVISIYSKNDLDGYASYASRECPMCKAGVKLDALVNSHGISSF